MANSRRAADHEREERRAEIDALSKTVEEKIRENEALTAEIEMLKLGSDMESVHDVIQNNTEEQQMKMNKLTNAEPLPVYHSIVNPGTLHNARQEYSLVKNELLIVKQENELLKKRIKDYEDVGVTN